MRLGRRTRLPEAQRQTLLPYFADESVGLVTIWNDRNTPYLSLWRSVFERRAPEWIDKVEALVAPDRLGQGTTTSAPGDEVLAVIGEAYSVGSGARPVWLGGWPQRSQRPGCVVRRR